ncbi:LLM class flavin-dependent oxidoreductase [Ancylobacter sp. 6x-1]|uniref:LLM class flavin-dependent oxidoreductase n=1 Tax=Ancylobacter crimeensis TaxID=2579147 RepID=A0ABT0DBH1_9HYPH|nr:LLM class flavin-dependent oxidoreductase [Ancylobacter crimeensis]MCK0197313.1 LLM class flavin-dependent oxidoreductase [Ancylobacter crimeensis]
MNRKTRFGIFMPPWNSPPTQNITTSLQRNLETIQWIDALGYDEAWVGEHHSAGSEIVADPMIFLAHAAAQTRSIRLGTGIVPLPYHNPYHVAERMILMDHLLRGRFMAGFGPGGLPSDAAMFGLDPRELRPALDHDLGVLMRLLTSTEPVSVKTDRYTLVDAVCQLAPFTDPLFDVCVAATRSEAGPRIAGRHGLGLLSTGVISPQEGEPAPPLHWDVYAAEARAAGHVPDPRRWRLVVNIHVAETRRQAIEDMRYGYDAFCEYTQRTIAMPAITAQGATFEERIAWMNEGGIGVVGTPDDAVDFLKRLAARAGDFGCILMLAHDWVNTEASRRHYELFARHVVPHFQPSRARLLEAERRAQASHAGDLAKNTAALNAWLPAGQRLDLPS